MSCIVSFWVLRGHEKMQAISTCSIVLTAKTLKKGFIIPWHIHLCIPVVLAPIVSARVLQCSQSAYGINFIV